MECTGVPSAPGRADVFRAPARAGSDFDPDKLACRQSDRCLQRDVSPDVRAFGLDGLSSRSRADRTERRRLAGGNRICFRSLPDESARPPAGAGFVLDAAGPRRASPLRTRRPDALAGVVRRRHLHAGAVEQLLPVVLSGSRRLVGRVVQPNRRLVAAGRRHRGQRRCCDVAAPADTADVCRCARGAGPASEHGRDRSPQRRPDRSLERYAVSFGLGFPESVPEPRAAALSRRDGRDAARRRVLAHARRSVDRPPLAGAAGCARRHRNAARGRRVGTDGAARGRTLGRRAAGRTDFRQPSRQALSAVVPDFPGGRPVEPVGCGSVEAPLPDGVLPAGSRRAGPVRHGPVPGNRRHELHGGFAVSPAHATAGLRRVAGPGAILDARAGLHVGSGRARVRTPGAAGAKKRRCGACGARRGNARRWLGPVSDRARSGTVTAPGRARVGTRDRTASRLAR